MLENEQDIELENEIMKQYDDNYKIYDLTREKYITLIKDLLHNKKITYNTIDGRVKDRESLRKKIENKRKYTNINEITDIVGIRIITYYADDVDRIADLISHEFLVDQDNTIDKRKAMEPDRFGYLSLHYVVQLNDSRNNLVEYEQMKDIKVEIQIRTILQHAWAESEHDLGYKSEKTIPNDFKRKFSRLAGLLEIADSEFMQIRDGLKEYSDQVTTKLESKETEEIALDTISLKAYIRQSEIIKGMKQEISRITEVRFKESDIYSSIIDELNWFGCFSINMLNSMVMKNRDIAVIMVIDLIRIDQKNGKTYSELLDIFIIIFVNYAKLVSDNYTDEKVMEFCEMSYSNSPQSMYNFLINYRKQNQDCI